MIAWLQGIRRLKSPTDQLGGIERQEPSLEDRLERLLGRLGRFNTKTISDLDKIINDLDKVLDIVEKIIAALENIGGVKGADRWAAPAQPSNQSATGLGKTEAAG